MSAPELPPWYIEPTFAVRLFAALLDGAVLLLPFALVTGLTEGWVERGIGLAISAVYHIGLTAYRGQTLGKVVLGTRTVDLATGEVPPPGQAAIRWVTAFSPTLFSLAVPAASGVASVWLVVVLVPILMPPLHRGIHDRVAGTIVTAVTS
jgi:uncharacterized RDD family membrane protein YckC